MRSGYDLMGLLDRLKLAETAVEPGVKHVESDRFQLEPDADGVVRQPCWFCGGSVEFRASELSGDAAVVMVQMLGTHEHLHGLAHSDCARRSQGVLRH
jgi:hypothetical protein